MTSAQTFYGNGYSSNYGYLYQGSESKIEDIQLNESTEYGSNWYPGTISTFVKGKGGQDYAYLSKESLAGTPQFNELGISKITTTGNTCYLLTGVDKLWLGDEHIKLGTGVASNSYLGASVKDSSQLIGPGTKSSYLDNNDNLFIVPGYQNKSDIINNADFFGGTDILVLPWESYRANLSKSGSSWRITTDQGQTASYWNLEYIQFSDKAVKLNNNGTLSDISFLDYAFNEAPKKDTTEQKNDYTSVKDEAGDTYNNVYKDDNGNTYIVEGDLHIGDNNNNSVNIGDNNTLGDLNVNSGSGTINTGEWSGNVFFKLSDTSDISAITQQWFGSEDTYETKSQVLDTESNPQLLDVATKAWSKKVKVNKIVQASNNGDTIQAESPEKFVPAIGSVLNGGQARDIVEGRIGWDIIDGGDGSDFIHGGNGRDVITGGSGGDELWGDFGLNTYKSEKDGSKDLIVIKSDHYVYNWLNNSYTNNPNGERTDFVEGLDSFDKIRITGVQTSELRFQANVTHGGQTGIAIYAKESLEVLYTGNDLSVDQLRNLTDGDGSVAATLNEVHQYGLGWW